MYRGQQRNLLPYVTYIMFPWLKIKRGGNRTIEGVIFVQGNMMLIKGIHVPEISA